MVARVAGRLLAHRLLGVLPRPPVVVPVAALDLVRGGGCAPEELIGKPDRHGGDPGTLDTMSVLDEILATKRDEVTVLHQPATRDAIRTAALAAAPPLDFAAALRTGGRLAVIA